MGLLGPNADGELPQPGRVPDCYLGLRLDPPATETLRCWWWRVGFPHTTQVIQVTRKTRDLRSRRWRTVVVYAVTSLTFAQASPARLADLLRGHWAIEHGLH